MGKILFDWSPKTPSRRDRSRGDDSSPERKRRRSPRRSSRRSPRSSRKEKQRKGNSAKDKKEKEREAPKEKSLETRTAGPKGKRILIAIQNKKGIFCSGYNGHHGCTKTDCKFMHKCNVMISDTEVCMGDHSAQEHKGKKVKTND